LLEKGANVVDKKTVATDLRQGRETTGLENGYLENRVKESSYTDKTRRIFYWLT
jgi:hypothetical protein